MSGLVNCIRQTFSAYPHHVGSNIFVVRENYSRSNKRHPRPVLFVPLLKETKQLSTRILMLEARLSGHVEFSFDDFITLAVVRHQREISGSEFFGGRHVALSFSEGCCVHSKAKRA